MERWYLLVGVGLIALTACGSDDDDELGAAGASGAPSTGGTERTTGGAGGATGEAGTAGAAASNFVGGAAGLILVGGSSATAGSAAASHVAGAAGVAGGYATSGVAGTAGSSFAAGAGRGPGSTGAAGTAGAIAVAGWSGTTGVAGTAGLVQAAGASGALSAAGTAGAAGSTGTAGAAGTAGSEATNGGGGGAGGIAGDPSWKGGAAGIGAAAGAAGSAPASLLATTLFFGNDNQSAPLVGIVQVESNLPSTVQLQISGGGETWELELASPAQWHERPILGLRPDMPYVVTATVTAGSQQVLTDPVEWHTPPLPSDFPRLELVQANSSLMEPGLTLFNVRIPTYLIVVDAAGQVRWFHRSNSKQSGHRLLSNGHIIYSIDRMRLIEIDWLGNQVADWYAEHAPNATPLGASSVAVDATALHHSVHEMPNGNLLALSVETREVDNFPTSTSDPDAPVETRLVAGDVILEFTRAGELVHEVSLLDLLDPTRVGHDSLGPHWDNWFPGSADWSHGNSATYDASSDAYLVSLRHQDAVIKVDRTTGSLTWILGNPANWGEPWQDKLLAPLGTLEWPYHQHAAEVVGGCVEMYDNGNMRAPAYAPEQTPFYSRAVRYTVDDDAMTVEQTWSYGSATGPEHFYSWRMSDADWQAGTGNMLIVSGALRTETTPDYEYIQVLELTEDGTPVFDLLVRDEPGPSPTGHTAFEGERIADLRFLDVD